jgi:alkaline phosphatase
VFVSLKSKALVAILFVNLATTSSFFSFKESSFPNVQAASESVIARDVPKNVILLIGDGMGIGQLEIARLFEYGKNGRLFMESLENVALMHTYSYNNIVTDSGAGGTAISTGKKTKNESIGVDENGREIDSILDLFKANGKKVGIISTNTVTDATPAAFTVSVANRWGQEKIARQLVKNEYDVLLGGGSQYFSPKKQNGEDLIEKFRKKGYAVVMNRNELMKVGKPDKLLGLFHPSYMSYKQDREEYNSDEPTLNEMTAKALDVLSKGKNGFFLMVEGARIDHASHAADIPGVWKETIELDNTVRDVVNWAKKRNDTLIVVLADHETMGISATEPMDIKGLKKIRVSPEYMATKLVTDKSTGMFTRESVKKVFKTYAHIDLTDKEVTEFLRNVKETKGKVYTSFAVAWEIGSVIAKHYKVGIVDRAIRAESSTGGHTDNMVPVFATGVGSEIFEGVLDNTDISKLIAKAAKLEFTPGEKVKKQSNN